jgi:hypothetical protein
MTVGNFIIISFAPLRIEMSQIDILNGYVKLFCSLLNVLSYLIKKLYDIWHLYLHFYKLDNLMKIHKVFLKSAGFSLKAKLICLQPV